MGSRLPTDLCRVVHIQWDGGSEEFDAVVRAEGPDGVVVSQAFDLWVERGFKWIRRDQVVSIEDLEPHEPTARLADLRGERAERLDPSLASLESLLDHLIEEKPLIAVWEIRHGAEECLVGRLEERASRSLVLDEVRSDGTRSGDDLEFELQEISSIEWGTEYLAALTDLVESPDPS